MYRNDKSHMSAHWLVNALIKRGVSKQDITHKLGIATKEVEDPFDRVPINLYFSIMNWAAEVCDDDYFGINLVEDINLLDMGLYGYLLNNAPTLRDFCEIFSQYFATLTISASLQLESLKNSSRIVYEILYPITEDPRHDVEMTLAIPINVFRQKMGANWQPLEVHFSHSSPRDLKPISALFGDRIYFDQPSNFIEFDNRILNLTVEGSDPQLFNILKDQADEFLLKKGDVVSVVSKVRYILFHNLGTENADSYTVASQLNMSRSSLFRRLKEMGTSFKKIKNGVIEEMAKKALVGSQSSVTNIALMLGYSELSAFTRAFRHISGVSPFEYRKQNLK